MLPVVLDHLFGALTALESPKYSQNAHFSAFRALYLRPLVAKSKSAFAIPCGLA